MKLAAVFDCLRCEHFYNLSVKRSDKKNAPHFKCLEKRQEICATSEASRKATSSGLRFGYYSIILSYGIFQLKNIYFEVYECYIYNRRDKTGYYYHILLSYRRGWGLSLENTGEGGWLANCHLKKKKTEIYHKIHFP